MYIKLSLLVCCICQFAIAVMGQAVGIGTTTPHSSSKVEISSTNTGVLLPRMSTSQRKAIANPAVGLLVFDLDKNSLYMYDGSNWLPIQTSSANDIHPIVRTVSDAADGDSLGFSVAISGNYAVATAPGDDINGNVDQGSAYIFFKQNGVWTEQAKITASDGAANDRFGYSVAISGDYVVIGAPFDANTFIAQGSAYVFFRNGTTWSEQAKLLMNEGANIFDCFGYSVSISGNFLLVGTPNYNWLSGDEGAAFTFIRSGSVWIHQATFTHPGRANADNFGSSVSISGSYLAIGAPGRDTVISGNPISGSGAIYLYFNTGSGVWNLQQRIGGTAIGISFGTKLYLTDPFLSFVGWGNASLGLVFFYQRSGTTWSNMSPVATAQPVSIFGADWFGWGQALTQDYCILGSFQHTVTSIYNYSGAAFLYKRNGNTWQRVRQITDPTPWAGGHYGYSCGIDGFNIIIGSKGKNLNRGEIQFLNIE